MLKRIKENDDFMHDGISLRNVNHNDYMNARNRRLRMRQEALNKVNLEKRMDKLESTLNEILILLRDRNE